MMVGKYFLFTWNIILADVLLSRAAGSGSLQVVPIPYLTIEHANASCQNQGGTLGSIHSAEEQQLIEAQASKLTGNCAGQDVTIMLGLRDPDKTHTFTWLDGTPLDYTHWDVGEPDYTEWDQEFVYLLQLRNYYWHNWEGTQECTTGYTLCRLLPTTTTSQLPTTVTSQLPTTMTSQLPTTVTSQLPTTMTSQLPTTVTSQLPMTTTSQLQTTTTSQPTVDTTFEEPQAKWISTCTTPANAICLSSAKAYIYRDIGGDLDASLTQSISNAWMEGFEFFINGTGEGINQTSGAGIIAATRIGFMIRAGAKDGLPCEISPARNYPNPTLWQFEYSLLEKRGGAVGKIRFITCDVIVTETLLHRPQCLPGLCSDDDCQTCYE